MTTLHPLPTSLRRAAACCLLFLLAMPPIAAQQAPAREGQAPGTPAPAASAQRPLTYVLGPGDGILIRARDAEEISDKTYVIEGDGYISLPRIGRMQASGLRLPDIEAAIAERLKVFIRSPQVVVTIAQFRNDTVFLNGAFVKPGTYPLESKRKLSQQLSMAGGLAPSANRRIKITRRSENGKLPLTNAIEDKERGVSEAEIDVRKVLENINSPEDILLIPSDTITATPREKIYVTGMISRVGALDLEDREFITVSQAIALVGLTPESDIKKAKVLRPVMDSNRRVEIPVNADKIMKGQANDLPLLPNDVLVIPKRGVSAGKVLMYILPVVAAAGISALIYTAIQH